MAEKSIFETQPISNIHWIETSRIVANSYNPNVVMNSELGLLKSSLMKNGWIQPLLLNQPEKESDPFNLIDGYHRFWLCLNDKELQRMFNGCVPCVIFNLPQPECMLLTVRINRAKGSHVAIRMHELVSTVFNQFSYTKQEIAKQIGADIAEINLLLQENVFTKLDVANHSYSKAWVPFE